MAALPAIIAGAAIGTSLLDTLVGSSNDKKNYKLGKETLEWQKQAQQTTWDREDNSVQRRVADLKKAGLSPVLAAGQGAQSSAPIQVSTPRHEKSWSASQSLNNALAVRNAVESIANTQEQRKLIKAQIDKTNVETAEKGYNLGINQGYGLPTNTSGIPKTVRDGVQMLKSFSNNMPGINPVKEKATTSFNLPGLKNAQEKAYSKRAKQASKSVKKRYDKYVTRKKQEYKASKLRAGGN